MESRNQPKRHRFAMGCFYAKKCYILAVLLSVVIVLVTYTGCSANEGRNSFSGFDTNAQVVFDGDASTGLGLGSYGMETAKDPYNSSNKFSPGDSDEMVLVPGDVVVKNFIYVPMHLGSSSGKLVLQTSVSGFIIQAEGFVADDANVCTSAKGSNYFYLSCPSKHGVSFAEEALEAFLQPYGSEFRYNGGRSISPEVVRVEVSGPECGLNVYLVRNCKCFYVLPGEAVRFQVSDYAALSVATPQVELDPAFATVVKKPNDGSSRIYMFKKSMFWIRVRKVLLVLLTTTLLYLLVCPLSLRCTTFRTEDFASRKNSFLTAVRALNSLQVSSNLVVSFATSSKMKVFLSGEEVLLLETLGKCSDVYHKQTGLLDTRPGTGLESTVLSKSSSMKNSCVLDASSQNLGVGVGKEKGRKRRKKKSRDSGAGIISEVVLSSSQSSIPQPSLSPIISGISLAQASDLKHMKSKNSKTSSKADNHKLHFCAPKKPNLVRTVLGKFHSPIVSSTPNLPLHARAPGAKIQKTKTEVEEKSDLKEKFIYNIWGDHLFGAPPSYQLMVLSDTSVSFFVGDPWTLMKSFRLQPVSSEF